MPKVRVGNDKDPLVEYLLKTLGLPKTATWFELRCAVGEVVTVKCGYYPEKDDGTIVHEQVEAKYELHRIDV